MTVRPAEAPTATGRLRAAWRAAHAPVDGAPRWARITAYAIPLTVLPSGIWRIMTVVFHVGGDGKPQGMGAVPSWIPGAAYVIFLSVGSELLAFTAVGLIAAWGEAFPRWIPGLRERRVPTPAAVVPAALGAAVLTAMWTTVAVTSLAGVTLQGHPLPADHPLMDMHGWRLAYFYVSYAPLLLWGPLLAAVTVAYWRRRAHVARTLVSEAAF